MIAAAVCKDPKIGSTEFEEPMDLRKTKGTQVNFEKCWFLEFRIKSTICSIRNSRNQQFFRIYQGFYGSSKILWFLEFRTKKEKVQLLTITHFSFFLSCHFFFFCGGSLGKQLQNSITGKKKSRKGCQKCIFSSESSGPWQ